MTDTIQKENLMINADRTCNKVNLYLSLKPNELKLLGAIELYMNELRRPSKELEKSFHDIKELRSFKNENLINLTPDFIFSTGIITKSNYTSNKNANYEARKITKSLVSNNVLVKIKSKVYKDLYIINPMIIYFGSTFGDCYINYQQATNNIVDAKDPYLQNVYREYHNGKPVLVCNPIEKQQVLKMKNDFFSTDNNVSTDYTDPTEETLNEPTSAFRDFFYSRPRQQTLSPYALTYGMLKAQYEREQVGLPHEPYDPIEPAKNTKIPYNLNA